MNPIPSKREVEVLFWLAQGCTRAQAGRRLWITENTVQTHLKRLYIRLGAANRSQALAIAYQSDWWGYNQPPSLWLRDGDLN